MDDKKFINLGLLTPVERRAWDVAIAVAREAEARYGMRLHVSVTSEETGYMLSAVGLDEAMEWSQLIGHDFIGDAESAEAFSGLIRDRLLRQLAKWRDSRSQPATV